jgi:hypothetical protein
VKAAKDLLAADQVNLPRYRTSELQVHAPMIGAVHKQKAPLGIPVQQK